MPKEYTGGLGAKGAAALKDFVQQGGTLILLNHASDYGEALGVTAKSVLHGVESKEIYSPGSLLNVSLDTKSPLVYGVPGEITIWSEGSPAWDAPEAQVVARYPPGVSWRPDGSSAKSTSPGAPPCSMSTWVRDI